MLGPVSGLRRRMMRRGCLYTDERAMLLLSAESAWLVRVVMSVEAAGSAVVLVASVDMRSVFYDRMRNLLRDQCKGSPGYDSSI